MEITCQTGNKYTEIPTVDCIHSKFDGKNASFRENLQRSVLGIICPQLVPAPNELEKGNLVVQNRGTLFGTCIGNQEFQKFDATPECPDLEVYVYDEKYNSEHEVLSIVEMKVNLTEEVTFFAAEVIFSHEVLVDQVIVR